MKKLSKIHIKGTIFISTNLLSLIITNKISNATPTSSFSKPSTITLLGEALRNPSESFIQILPNGNLKANFLISGKRGICLRNFNIKGGSTVAVKKTIADNFQMLSPKKSHKKLTSEGIVFKIFTSSKNGFDKEIDIFQENGNIVVHSKKGLGTPNYVIKSTILNFGDGASTSSQKTSSNEPKIISNRFSNYNEKEGKFIIEQTNIYDPLSLKLLSSTIKNNLTGETSSDKTNQDVNISQRDVFFKPSIIDLLTQTIANPEMAPITKTPDGKIKARFLHYGRSSNSTKNLLVRSKSTVKVKKNVDDNFTELEKGHNKMYLEDSGIEFNVNTRSKYGLDKEINISQENGNIVVNSIKGVGTPKHTIKKTILDFGDDSSPPQIKQTKLYLPNSETKQFDIEENITYDATNRKLISQTTKNNFTGESENIYRNQDNTKTKIIEQSNGNKDKYLLTESDEIIYSERKDNAGNILITRKLNKEFLSSKKFSPSGNLIEESISSPQQYESRTYDENGAMTSSTRTNTLSAGDSIGTTIYSNGESITQERRGDGSLKTTIIRTTTGELLKQDFNENGEPLNNPYKIN